MLNFQCGFFSANMEITFRCSCICLF